MSDSALDKLRTKLGKEWPAIVKARDDARQEKKKLQQLLTAGKRLEPPDASLVVFGSLAREEWTRGSDLDWTPLVDGQVDIEHQRNTLEIAARLDDAAYLEPGPTGVFGNIAFSHPIVHQIGGDDDTNKNTTQRILLLLESVAIGDPRVHDRVRLTILRRYLEGDPSFVLRSAKGNTVPRFLLNDVVRFWRTMAVDFAAKQHQRGGEGWGLRNAKLRFSRKLTFMAGLILCLDCHYLQPEIFFGDSWQSAISDRLTWWLSDVLASNLSLTPLERVAQFLIDRSLDVPAESLLDAYDGFLAILADKREHLKKLKYEAKSQSFVFRDIQDLGHKFQTALTSILFNGPDDLKTLVQKYGIF